MAEESAFTGVFASIISKEGITDPIDRLELEGIHDEPGFHWSNPGVKLVSAYACGQRYPFVLKRLGEHSKREVPVYRFLSVQEAVPAPKLFHDMYDDDRKEYWIIIERCVGREFDRPEDFWEQCGLLLARIHAPFWDRTDALPDFFHMDMETERLRKAVEKANGFLESLEAQEKADLEHETGFSLSSLHSVLKGVNRERLPDPPDAGHCLIHGSFHSPEIMWRDTPDGYMPVGVDWERSRAGIPAEDLAFSVNTLLAKGEDSLFGVLLDTYLSELGRHGSTLSRDSIEASICYENLVHTMSALIPFLLPTLLRVRHDEAYREWCLWARQDIPQSLRFLQSEIESGRIYEQ